ncbi:Ff.00g091490.m01.CDS01 [Fusarium sp. VM40]|nr:Ff.00g091490.m01.CDS01 [Fusarium sp. VM40]
MTFLMIYRTRSCESFHFNDLPDDIQVKILRIVLVSSEALVHQLNKTCRSASMTFLMIYRSRSCESFWSYRRRWSSPTKQDLLSFRFDDLPHDIQDDIQAENRAHRLGQKRDIEIIRLIASNIYKACQKKIELASSSSHQTLLRSSSTRRVRRRSSSQTRSQVKTLQIVLVFNGEPKDLSFRFNDLPDDIQVKILQIVLAFNGEPIHATSRLDPYYEPQSDDLNGDNDGDKVLTALEMVS